MQLVGLSDRNPQIRTPKTFFATQSALSLDAAVDKIWNLAPTVVNGTTSKFAVSSVQNYPHIRRILMSTRDCVNREMCSICLSSECPMIAGPILYGLLQT